MVQEGIAKLFALLPFGWNGGNLSPNHHETVLLLGLENEISKIAEHGTGHRAGTQ